ncbi:MAG: hypothetical protein QF888_00135, partial [Desulfobacterales bacterium]|nr:hypothetical protein [Desulfobacterales bacterium]
DYAGQHTPRPTGHKAIQDDADHDPWQLGSQTSHFQSTRDGFLENPRRKAWSFYLLFDRIFCRVKRPVLTSTV